MKRKIIEIDENLCNGCGACMPNCPEGALQIIDGKARLVSDIFCDGLGACVGKCPIGAMKIVEREAEEYSERKAMMNIIPKGINTIKAHLKHLQDHKEHEYYQIALQVLKEEGISLAEAAPSGGCGGCAGGGSFLDRFNKKDEVEEEVLVDGQSQLRQWPTQLQLVSPNSPFFRDAELLVVADCVPFAMGNFHDKMLKGKAMVQFCPKLDGKGEEYRDKLIQIITNNNIQKISIARMEVPCCGGVAMIVNDAISSIAKEFDIKVEIVTIDGKIK